MLYDMQKGFTLIARKSRAVVVPAALKYYDDIIEVVFGDPIPYDEYVSWSSRHFASTVTRRVQAMSGQTLAGRVAEIASKAKSMLKKDRK